MLYKLLHKLFGWHYIGFKYGGSYLIRRVRPLGDVRIVRAYGDEYIVQENGYLCDSVCYYPLTFKIEEKNEESN